MTGFGKSVIELPDKVISVEIKSLNSKNLDLNMKIPTLYREKEMEIRNLLFQTIERGKVDFNMMIEYLGKTNSTQINTVVVENYYYQLKQVVTSLQMEEPSDWLSILLKLPETIKTETTEIDVHEWNLVLKAIDQALSELCNFRQQEGSVLQQFFEEKIVAIFNMAKEIEKFEPERLEKIKLRIREALSNLDSHSYDENRFEQELIYYIERLDIHEEQQRLDNHLHYFLHTLKEEKSQGRKLNFILQEIGREINTLGSKSNHADMQQIVVNMKDELEQMKEQVLNII